MRKPMRHVTEIVFTMLSCAVFTTALRAQSECISKITPSSNPRLPVEIAYIIFSSQTHASVKTYNLHHSDLTNNIWFDIIKFKPSSDTMVRLEYSTDDEHSTSRKADVINESTNEFLGVLLLENEARGSLALTYSDGAVSLFPLMCRELLDNPRTP